MLNLLVRYLRLSLEGPLGATSARWSRWLGRLLCTAPVGLLAGCHLALFDPKGDVGVQERHLIVLSLALMLMVVIPVIALTLFFFWRYRASNTKATYAPTWAHSTKIEIVVWAIPCLIVAFLAVLIWRSTHVLDPYRPLASDVPPVRVQVVALNWKWLFIYPDYGVASVNQLVIPAGMPVDFVLTADSLMNSFFIPRLGSQIYAMAGMQTQLHLIADAPGVYAGMSSAYSGEGFSDMRFNAIATTGIGFRQWIQRARGAPTKLTRDAYRVLSEPSSNQPAMVYADADPSLFQSVVNQYMPKPKTEDMSAMMPPELHDMAPMAHPTIKQVKE